jgi:predicted nucleic acid-binding protein
VILADSSFWIDFLIDPSRVPGAFKALTDLVTCGPVVQEVLQGLREDHPMRREFRQSFLELPRLSDPMPLDLFLEAAEIYHDGRRRGYTIRSSVDCLIAAIAIRNEVPLWHRDRDFDSIARYTRLRAIPQYLT